MVLRSEERLLADDGRAMGSASCQELGSVVRECFDWGFGGVVDDWDWWWRGLDPITGYLSASELDVQ